MTRLVPLTAALLFLAAPLAAQSAPPAGALPLSQIIAQVEATPGLAFIDDVDWDDDGYWEVEYRTTEGGRVEIRVDPLTGAIRR